MAEGGGEADADAQDAFRHLLTLDPGNANARYFVARARIAGGDVAGGLADWRALQGALPPSDPRSAALARDIAQVSSTGHLPADVSRPDASVGAPQIQAMVDGLAARLQAQPDDPQGWVRLVRALSVLGETDRRDAALAAARQRYAGHADVLAALAAAARPQTASVSPPPATD